MSNSPLVDYTLLSPNHSGKRKHVIDTISIHCVAGNATVEALGRLFANPDRNASSQYGISSDGRIGQYVDEENRSWCTSSSSNDNRAITIEVANTVADEPWPVSDAAYKSLINLLVDICQRNGIKKLLWKADKSLIGQVDQQNMTVHRWFANKACPGEWLYSRHGQIAAEVNSRLEGEEVTQEQFNAMMNTYLTQLAEKDAAEWSAEEREWAESNGLIQGDGTGRKQYKAFCTREQMVVFLKRLADLLSK